MKTINKFIVAPIVLIFALEVNSSDLKNTPTISSIVNVYSQNVAVDTPTYFFSKSDFMPGKGFRQDNGSSFLMEVVPYGQTVEDWNEMITITGEKNLSTVSYAIQSVFALLMLEEFKKNCPASFSFMILDEESDQNKQSFVASCGSFENKSETAVIQVIKGVKDLYTIQWAFRGKESKIPLVLNKEDLLKKIKILNPRVLDK